jgi:hypothetical protein
MKLKFIWKVKTGQFQNGEKLYLNSIHIASYSWNGLNNTGDNAYVGYTVMQTHNERIYAPTIEAIKAKIEKLVTDWFTEALK